MAVFGFVLVREFADFAIPLGILGGVIYNQMSRILEYEADNFAVKRIDNPQGMITATEKFRKAWNGTYKVPFWQGIFYRAFFSGVPYADRIKIAETEIKTRT